MAPIAVDAGRVPYPEGASGDAEVVVELLVDTAGTVREVTILEGTAPFSDSVRSKAPTFLFEPARRNGTPIPARIRMRIAFRAPAPVAPNVPPPPPPRSSARVDDVEDVTIFGSARAPGQLSMTQAEVRQLPGAFGDPFRALEALPGVTPLATGLPFFFVRGAPPGNTGYFIDGIPVPSLYHIAVGPGVIHPSLIERVDFYPGGYPARYGRFTGGVLAGETTAPSPRAKLEGNLRLFDVGLLAQTPFANGRGEALVGGRYGYPGPIISLLAPDVRVAYWDYQARFGYRLTDADTISLFAFGSFDEIALQQTKPIYYGALGPVGEESTGFYPIFRSTFHRVDLRWDHKIGARGTVRTAVTAGYDETLSSGPLGGAAAPKSRGPMVALRTAYEERLSPTLKVRAGADVAFTRYEVTPAGDLDEVAKQLLVPTKSDVDFGVRADVVWRAHPRVEVVPGIRIDYFSSTPVVLPFSPPPTGKRGILAVDPRIASRVAVTKDVTLVSTFGVAHQKPSASAPIAGFSLGTLVDGLQTSIQASQGVEVKLPLGFDLTMTGFVQNIYGLTDQTAVCDPFEGIPTTCALERVRGRTFGGELLLRRDLTKRITGFISYTLSRSTRESNGLGSLRPLADRFGRFQGAEVLSEFDRTHVLNVVAAVDLGRGWRFGTRFNLYSGRPYTGQSFLGHPIPPFNTQRMPPFWRIDVRLEKEWKLGERGRVAFVVEGLNVTANRETLNAVCPSVDTPTIKDCKLQSFGPIAIPSIGIEGSY